MDYWSNGTKKALFLTHEGYFGAVGCLGKLVDVTQTRRLLRTAAMANGCNINNNIPKSKPNESGLQQAFSSAQQVESQTTK